MKNPALRGVFFNTEERVGHLRRIRYHGAAAYAARAKVAPFAGGNGAAV
jgi:hypothetical protein